MVMIGYCDDVDLRRIDFLGEQFRGNVSFPSLAFSRQRMAMQVYFHAQLSSLQFTPAQLAYS